MTNPLFAEALARQHQQDLLDQAARARLVRRAGDGAPPWWALSWRVRAGRVLIRAGERVAGARRARTVDALSSAGAHHLAAAWRDAAS
jgi:hypothetical protein